MLAAVGLKYWREVALVTAIFLLMAACADRDRALVERGQAQQRTHVADSLLALNAAQLAPATVRVEHDTATVLRLATRVMTDTLWRSDTIFMASDTAHEHPAVPIPLTTLASHDSLAKSCTALAHDCGEYKRLAEARFKLYEEKLAVQPTQIKVSCIQPTLLGTIAGAGAGYYFGRRSR